MKKTIETASSEETRKVAQDLASTFVGGEVVLALGTLGAGKTCFSKGIGKALGVKETINSPTFNLIKVYQGDRLSYYHVDCYRLEDVDERRKDIGLEDFVGEKDTVTYIEWPEFAPAFLKGFERNAVVVTFEILDEDRRRITIDDRRS